VSQRLTHAFADDVARANQSPGYRGHKKVPGANCWMPGARVPGAECRVQGSLEP
jgi:hypothetical protein